MACGSLPGVPVPVPRGMGSRVRVSGAQGQSQGQGQGKQRKNLPVPPQQQPIQRNMSGRRVSRPDHFPRPLQGSQEDVAIGSRVQGEDVKIWSWVSGL